ASMRFLYCVGGCIVKLLNVLAGYLLPFVRVENTERERIKFSGRTANAVGVVFDDKQRGQLFLFRGTDRFEEITLPSGGVAVSCDDDIFFAIQLNSPGHSATGKNLGTGRRRHA